MPTIRIAGAQYIAIAGDVAANVKMHMKFIIAAHQERVDLLVFPELSLCGYELPLLQKCVLLPTDSPLDAIREIAIKTEMTIVVGAPVSCGEGTAPAIGAITFFSDGRHSIYRKQHLHPAEERFAAKGKAYSRTEELLGRSYSLAICADTTHESHAANAAVSGASLYLAGVLISEGGYADDAGKMQQYATRHNFGVLMVNHGGPSGGYVSAGRSAFWAPGGKIIVQAQGTGNILVIAEENESSWSGRLISVDE